MTNYYTDASAALSGLKERLRKGRPSPTETPTTLPLHTIELIPKLFQPRDMRHDQIQSTYHIESLTKALDSSVSGSLNPITVWWSGDSWIVIDGHHRLAAYEAHQSSKKKRKHGHKHMSDISTKRPPLAISVVVFCGTLTEAVLHSTSANSQDKLPMSKDSKLTRAWQLVTVELKELTLAAIARSCGIHNRSVSNMRSVWNKGKAECDEEQLAELKSLSWKQARHWNKDIESNEWGAEEREAEINRIRDSLIKTYGKTLLPKAALFAEAIERYSPALARELIEHLIPQPVANGSDFCECKMRDASYWDDWEEEEEGEEGEEE